MYNEKPYMRFASLTLSYGVQFTELPKREFNHLFFHCDVLAWRAVGDVQAPLLAVLPNKTEEMFGSIIRRFQNVRYVKVDKKYFDAINLNIRDDMGRPMRFQTGNVFVELHFQPVKQP